MHSLHLRGVCLPDEDFRDVWVHKARITFDEVPGAETIATQGWIVPGLADAHCHLGLSPQGPVTGDALVQQAYTDRDAGALVVRDCGSPVDTRWLVDRMDVPRLIRAGRHLARVKRYLPGVALELEPHQLPMAVEEQARYGGGWVKIVADWIDRSVGDLTPLWPREVLIEAVGRAHAAGAKVAAHTFSDEAIPDLLDAGVDSVEHGTGLDEDSIATLAERGIALVPTLINIDTFPAIAERAHKYPRYAERMRRLHRTSRARIRAAYEAGVPIYAGTDAGGVLLHGRVVDEIQELRRAGMSTVDALAAGSWAAREWLGLPGIAEGAPADLVVYESDPREDLAALAYPSRIVLRGSVVS